MKSDGKIIRGDKSCNYYKFDNLTLTIGGLDFEIPPFLYTQTVDQRCEIMIEINDETSEKLDDIETENDGKDYLTSSGYILGTPFLRAFMILLDTERNKIGFANKINNFGAEILGEGAPGPARPKNDHSEKHDDETIPDDNKPEIIDDDEKDAQTDQEIPSPDDTNPSNPSSQNQLKLIVISAIGLITLIIAFCIIKCILKKRKEKNQMFAKTTKKSVTKKRSKS